MDNRERRDREMAYIADAAVNEEMRRCRRILQKLNFMDRSDFEGVAAVVKELLGESENAWINPPFYCDYGSHIKVGKNFFIPHARIGLRNNDSVSCCWFVKSADNCFVAPKQVILILTYGNVRKPIIVTHAVLSLSLLLL